MFDKKMESIFQYLFWLILIYFSYEFLQTVYFKIAYALISDYLWIDNNAMLMDCLFVIIISPIYIWWFYLFCIKDKNNNQKFNFKIGLLCILLAFVVNGISSIWFWIVDEFLYNYAFIADSYEIFDEMFSYFGYYEPYIWTLLDVVILGPIIEEIIFRGLMINILRKKVNYIWAIAISAVLFGIWHGILIQGVYTAIMGIILGYVYIKTDNLFYPILIHMGNNFINGLPPSWSTDSVYNLLWVISVVCIVPGLLMMLKMLYMKKTSA